MPGGKKSFNCNRCESKFRSKKEVLTHVKSSHDLSTAEDADDDEDEGEDEDDLEEEGDGDETDGEGVEESKYAQYRHDFFLQLTFYSRFQAKDLGNYSTCNNV